VTTGWRSGSITDGLARLANRRATAVFVAVWGFGEATIFPLVPDLLLYPLAVAAPRRAASLFGWTLVGAILGSLVLSSIALNDAAAARDLVLGVPGIRPDMLEIATASVVGGDPLSMVHLGPGVPLKLYSVAWWAGPGTPLAYVVGVIANRLVRIGAGVVVFAVLGWLAPGWVRRHEWLALAAYAAFWLVVAMVAGLFPGAPQLI